MEAKVRTALRTKSEAGYPEIVWMFSLMNSIVKLSHLTALAFAFYRLWLGAAVMLVAVRLTGRRLTLLTFRRAAIGGVLFGANLCFFFSALKLTSVADVLIVAALQPALTLTVAGPLFGDTFETEGLPLAA